VGHFPPSKAKNIVGMKACETRIGMNGTKRILASTTPLTERSALLLWLEISAG